MGGGAFWWSFAWGLNVAPCFWLLQSFAQTLAVLSAFWRLLVFWAAAGSPPVRRWSMLLPLPPFAFFQM